MRRMRRIVVAAIVGVALWTPGTAGAVMCHDDRPCDCSVAVEIGTKRIVLIPCYN